jgi:TolA-binding protein
MINGQHELAAVGLRDYLASKPDAKYLAPANGLLGAALENSKRWAEAAEAYMQASNASPVAYLKASYLVDAGRAYGEAGKTAEAERAYRTVIQKYADSPSFTEAQVRLAELTDGRM